MTELAEHQENAAHESQHDAPFVSLAHTMYEEHERLLELAEACRNGGQELVEREAALAERDRRISDERETLDRRATELDQRERELTELAARAHEAEARLQEAVEREAALAALGAELADRFRRE